MSLIPKLRRRARVPAAPPGGASSEPAGAPEPGIDPMLGDPAAHLLRTRMRTGDWRVLKSFLGFVPDHDDRAFYSSTLLATLEGLPAWLGEWIDAEPASALPRLLRGVRGTQWAWEARGSGHASTVSPEALNVFRDRLINADRDLIEAASLSTADPAPYVQMLVTARGLGMGANSLRVRFDEAVARDPLNYRAHAHMLQGIAMKWGGSHELMYEFARSAVAKAPAGHRLNTLIAEAHIEGWADGQREHRHLYWRVPGIREEIHAAAGRSVERSDFRAGAETALYRNVFAFCFWSLDEPGPLRGQLDGIGGDVTRLPWAYVGEPLAGFASARRYAVLAPSSVPVATV